MNDLVSVVIPIYNQGSYIDETLSSVCNQTYKNIEVIIVNDGSNEQETLCKLIELRERGYFVIDKNNGGLASARNVGIQAATGDFIVALDSDDIINDGYIYSLIKAMKSSNARIAYSRALLFDLRNGMWMLPKYSIKRMLSGNVIFCSAMFYREDWVLVGGYDESLKLGLEDWDFWLSIIERNVSNSELVLRLDKPLFYYRIRKNSMLRSIDLEMKRKTVDYIYAKHQSLFDSYNVYPKVEIRDNLLMRCCNKFLSKFFGVFFRVKR
ncbi:MAG: glycosyltransferase family A protein [Aeromonas sp.]|uniref:glycosyltransferase family 2 protein n=1 Tax=Aeromonas caviae TaxID=648 RepID=UPI002910DA27|nr:glycosyltransferase family A protein [Aeromonas caviae]MDU7311108.1 glycosyltransferase family A protein [Aeromonas sp.]MDX7804320.1 glycosyltransferase family A protein [Aeromonas caviae]